MRRGPTSRFTTLYFCCWNPGAFDHVCPKDFAAWIETLALGCQHEVVGADGTKLILYSTRTVSFQLLAGRHATIKFHVMNVLRPILSVSRLVQRQFMLVFGKQAFLERDGHRVALVRIAGLYYLPVYLKAPTEHQQDNLDFWQQVQES